MIPHTVGASWSVSGLFSLGVGINVIIASERTFRIIFTVEAEPNLVTRVLIITTQPLTPSYD